MAIQTTRPTARYKDFYNNMNAHPVRKDLFVLENEDSIKNSNKLALIPLPTKGWNRASLFENISENTAYIIKTQVETTIENFEPRANLLAVYVNPYPDQNGYNVKIVFSTINNPQPITFDVLLTRVR